MEIASKGLMPRLTPLLRLAFALASLFPLLPLVIVLGIYDLIPLTVIGFPRSGVTVGVGVAAGFIFASCLAIAITGWNPLHRVDVALAKLRPETESAPSPAVPQLGLSQRIVLVVIAGTLLIFANWLIGEGIARGIGALFR
jgi:hypothetical protein